MFILSEDTIHLSHEYKSEVCYFRKVGLNTQKYNLNNFFPIKQFGEVLVTVLTLYFLKILCTLKLMK